MAGDRIGVAVRGSARRISLPLEVSAIDSFASVTDAPERSLSLVARIPVELADVYTAVEAR